MASFNYCNYRRIFWQKWFYWMLIVFWLFLPLAGQSKMRSQNYVIYENVLHSFDGPVISNVSHSVSGNQVTITWTTDVPADSFVVYDTTNPFSNEKEQGNSSQKVTSHSVELTGLEYSTTYYYTVKSRRINGGITTDSNIYTFTTEAAPATTQPAAGGGGVLIIDKTDKEPPVISGIKIEEINSTSAVVRWQTDEEATSFVEYGLDEKYGGVAGKWEYVTEHQVMLENLNPATQYHLRILSSDDWGNLARSEDTIFTTSQAPEEKLPEEEKPLPEEKLPPEEQKPETDEELLAEASRKAIELFKKLSNQVSLNFFEETVFAHLKSIQELAGIVPAPILSGEPKLEIGADYVEISWSTDKEANSLVAIASDVEYNPNAAEPYVQVVGNAEELVTDHKVKVLGLKPDTLYHFQLRSKAAVGPTGKSRDFTFRTKLESLEIMNFFTKVIDDFSVTIKWVTNKETDSAVTIIPYRGNVLAVEEAKTFKDSAQVIIHEMTIKDFMPGIFYNIEITSRDKEGNSVTKTIERFTTAEDDLPPQISAIRAESSIFLDKSDKVQTVITWLTNEPSTSRVYYMEGVQRGDKEFKNKTKLIENYTKEHIVVIPNFKPGKVYSYRVESIDSGGNVSISKVHTFMTPKKRESIIQVIIRILEETFGWMKKLM